MSTCDLSAVASEAITAENWLDDAHLKWSLQHVEELLPTVAAPAGTRPPRPLRAVAGEPAGEWFEQFCASTAADAVLVIRRDQILLERYFGTMTADTRHLLMSVSKSVCGLIAGILVDRGMLELSRSTAGYVPELRGDPYGTATVRQLLDMTAALDFDMTHASGHSTVNVEDRATGWRPRQSADPADSHSFLQSLKAVRRPHGERFQYCSATTEVLAWVLERAAGLAYPRLVSELLWSRIGAERDAYFTVDARGTVYACAGMGATLRDLARLGCLVLDGGACAGEQVVPERWIAEIRGGGDPDKIAPHIFGTVYPGGSYRNQWWVTGDAQGSLYAAGLCSQYLWIDPASEAIVVKFSSQPVGVDGRAEHALGLRRLATLGARS